MFLVFVSFVFGRGKGDRDAGVRFKERFPGRME
jgi:hypothetical protein